MKPESVKKVLFLVGPTAVGKTTAALYAAKQLNAEIISADSMQVYRGMDIGTAKPSPEELASVPHHLIDILDPHQEFNAAKFAQMAGIAIKEIHSRAKMPLVAGGTPMYIKALAEGIFSSPPTNGALRRRLEKEYAESGPETMHTKLAAIDAVTAGKFHPNDKKRVIRALEVFELTGKPISAQQGQFGKLTTWMDPLFVGLRRPREELYERIDARVNMMITDGLVEEVKGILDAKGFGPQSSFALGYREIAAALTSGSDITAAIELVKRNTRHMARKQLTWFKHMPYVTWLDIDRNDAPAQISARVVGELKKLLAHPDTT